MSKKHLTMMSKKILVLLKHEINECENSNVLLSHKTKVIIFILLISPFITQITAISCNHSNIGYKIFMPNIAILFLIALYKRIKQTSNKKLDYEKKIF